MTGVQDLHPRNATLSDFIPRLRQGGIGDAQTVDARAAIREKIEKNRLEERRRLHRLGELQVATSRNSASTSSARGPGGVGAAYWDSCRIQTERTERLDRQGVLKRQVAGPIPPSSWEANFLHARTKGKQKADDAQEETRAALDRSMRYEICSYFRRVVATRANVEALGQESCSRGFDREVPSLADSCLECMLSTARRRHVDDLGQEIWDELLPVLPSRIAARLMSLAGSLAAVSPLTLEEVRQLWPAQIRASSQNSHGPAEETVVNWDEEAETLPDAALYSLRGEQESLASQAHVDLSFAPLTTRQLASLLQQSATGLNVHLRILSLAGRNFDRSSDAPSMLAVLGSFVNLEALSLAGSTLTLGHSDADSDLVGSPQQLWLSSLSRAVPKLRILDLSYCSWVTESTVRIIAEHRTLFRELRILNIHGSGFRGRTAPILKEVHAQGILLEL